jgi:hypothetical protein
VTRCPERLGGQVLKYKLLWGPNGGQVCLSAILPRKTGGSGSTGNELRASFVQ